jgi:hypothetical protein
MARWNTTKAITTGFISLLFALLPAGCGGYSNGGGGNGGGGGTNAPSIPSGLTASAANAQVNLTWNASSGATAYYVKRSTTTGGPYTQIAAPTGTSYADNSVTNGTKYYYVVSAYNSYGQSANSTEVNTNSAASSWRAGRSTGNTWKHASEPFLDSQHRRNELSRKAQYNQRRSLHASFGPDRGKLRRHQPH